MNCFEIDSLHEKLGCKEEDSSVHDRQHISPGRRLVPVSVAHGCGLADAGDVPAGQPHRDFSGDDGPFEADWYAVSLEQSEEEAAETLNQPTVSEDEQDEEDEEDRIQEVADENPWPTGTRKRKKVCKKKKIRATGDGADANTDSAVPVAATDSYAGGETVLSTGATRTKKRVDRKRKKARHRRGKKRGEEG